VAKLGEKLCAKPNQALIGLQMEGGAFKVLLTIEWHLAINLSMLTCSVDLVLGELFRKEATRCSTL
jgi:hypothetical protein